MGSSKRILGIVCAVALGARMPDALAGPWDMDTKFGDAGLVADDRNVAVDSSGVRRQLSPLPDGTLLEIRIGAGGTVLSHRDVDGKPDPAFGIGGSIQIAFPPGFGTHDAIPLLDSEGRFLWCGSMYDNNGGVRNGAIVRFTRTGTLDYSFGAGGIVSRPAAAFPEPGGGFGEMCDSLALQPDGRVVAAIARYSNIYGFAIAQSLWRFNPDGSGDVSFGTGTSAVFPTDQYEGGSNVRVLPNGWIMVYGGVNTYTLNADGSHRYNPWQIAGISQDQEWQVIGDTATAKLFLVSANLSGSVSVARLLPDGTLDRSFGGAGTGMVVIDIGRWPFGGGGGKAALNFIEPSVSQDGQRLYIKGFRQLYEGQAEGGVVRLHASGAAAGRLDDGFGAHGYLPLPMPHAGLVDQGPDDLLVFGPAGTFRLSARSGASPGVIGLKHAYVEGLQMSTSSIPVVRFAGRDGAVSVSFRTEDFYGKAGVNYERTSGNVSWADGDSADKSVAVKLLSGSDTVGNQFQLVLGDAKGGSHLQESSVDIYVRLSPDPNGGLSAQRPPVSPTTVAATPAQGVAGDSGGGSMDPLSLLLLILGGGAALRARARKPMN